jgi:hypothetical protein
VRKEQVEDVEDGTMQICCRADKARQATLSKPSCKRAVGVAEEWFT